MQGSMEDIGRSAYLATCFVAVATLGFVAGSVATLSEFGPARIVEHAYRAGAALYSKATQYSDPLQFDLWRPARTDQQGVTRYDPSKADNGLTLYTSGHGQKARLIDMQGQVVREWGVPFSQLWDKSAAVKNPQPDSHVYIEKTHLFPNGDLLALYVAVGDTPWGYGLVKYDRDNNVLWKYLGHVHHDLAVAPDGRVFVLSQEIGQDDLTQYPHLKAPRIDDYIVVLSPEGRELKKVRLIDSLLRSPYARLLDTVPWYIQKGAGDYLHTNSVEYPRRHQRARSCPRPRRAGCCFRSARSALSPSSIRMTDEIVWAMRGPWLRQHDPDLLANGNILLFDNQGHVGPGGITRVIEVDPRNQRDRLDLCRHARGAVRERGPLLAGASAQRQHADHRIGRRAHLRGDPAGRDRLELRQPGPRRSGRATRSRSSRSSPGPSGSTRRRWSPAPCGCRRRSRTCRSGGRRRADQSSSSSTSPSSPTISSICSRVTISGGDMAIVSAVIRSMTPFSQPLSMAS